MRTLFLVAGILLLSGSAFAEVANAPHVTLDYRGIDARQAQAIANTLSAAWTVYTEDFAFDLPDKVIASATVADDQPARLFTDGNDRVTLVLRSQEQLARPAVSGVFNLYGMCHELGHMAMYRTLKDRDWLSSAGAEGFAHYAGSVVVDRVYAAKGQSLWSDPYDYREDGTARLKKQLAGRSPDDVARAAGQWLALESIITPKSFAKLFAAWQRAGIDASRPDDALLAELMKLDPARKSALEQWWKSAGPLLVEKRQSSKVLAASIAANKLSGKPVKLQQDDGKADGQKSIAGGGHARSFQAPDDGPWYLMAVSVFGARYGPARAPDTAFDVALCEPDLKTISLWKKPYATFARGELRWVRIELPPTRVPREFSVCLNFRPTASSGVYVALDSSTAGHSLVGVPGKGGESLAEADWMIRVELDRPLQGPQK